MARSSCCEIQQCRRPVIVIVNQQVPRRIRPIPVGGAGEQRRLTLEGTFIEFTNALTVTPPILSEGIITGGGFFVQIVPNQPILEPLQVEFNVGFFPPGSSISFNTITLTGPGEFFFPLNETAIGRVIRPGVDFYAGTSVRDRPRFLRLTITVRDTSFIKLV